MSPESPLQAFMPVIVFGAILAAVVVGIIAWGCITGWIEDERLARERGLQRALAEREAKRRAYRELDDLYMAALHTVRERTRRQ